MFRRMAVGWLLLLLCGCSAVRSQPEPQVGPVLPGPSPQDWQYAVIEEPPLPPLPKPVETLPAGSVEQLLAEGLKLRVLRAEGAMPSVRRIVQLYKKTQDEWRLVNEVNVPYLPGESVSFRTVDLPGYPGAIVLEARRAGGVRRGAVALVEGRLVALDYHKLIAPKPEITEGVLLHLNKYLNQLWVYRDGSLVASFPTANGRDPWGTQPTWQDYKKNYKTPEGLFRVRQKIVNPPYNSLGGNHPPAAPGAPDNPLGTRWIGFEVLEGDGGGVWGFHGTYVPEQIGTWASEGCVRLNTADAEKLYDLVPMGAAVRIVSGR